MAGEEQWQPIGKVIGFFAHPSVAIIEIEREALKLGDVIRITGHTTNLEQTVESMQLEHQAIQEARVGQAVGIQVKERVRRHDVVYKAVR